MAVFIILASWARFIILLLLIHTQTCLCPPAAFRCLAQPDHQVKRLPWTSIILVPHAALTTALQLNHTWLLVNVSSSQSCLLDHFMLNLHYNHVVTLNHAVLLWPICSYVLKKMQARHNLRKACKLSLQALSFFLWTTGWLCFQKLVYATSYKGV